MSSIETQTPKLISEDQPISQPHSVSTLAELVERAECAAQDLFTRCSTEHNGDPVAIAAHEIPIRSTWWTSGVKLTRTEDDGEKVRNVPISPVAAVVKEAEDRYEDASIAIHQAKKGAQDAEIQSTYLPRLAAVRTLLQRVCVSRNGAAMHSTDMNPPDR